VAGDLQIFHNPSCSKSRGAMEILAERGVDADVTEYQKAPPTRAELERIVDVIDAPPAELVRKDKRFKELGLDAYSFAFQSAGRTDEPWLGPDILDEIRRLAADGVRELVIRPVGFVADHLEVLYDIDIEAQAVAREVGVRLERARSMNDDPTFIAGLADLAVAALEPSVAAPVGAA
jgi:hypothetical protein